MNDNAIQTRPESLAAIRLLQGVIYSADANAWQQVLTYRSDLEDYFGRIGLVLMVAEDDGLAYLRQRSDDERDADGDGLPRLMTRTPLSLNVTMLCVILRDEYRRFEDIDLDNTRCTVTIDDLLPTWKSMQPSKHDDVKNRETLVATMRKVEQMSVVAKFGEADEYEIKPILKARMPIDSLVELKNQIKQHIEGKSS
jgi:hypothetical protein